MRRSDFCRVIVLRSLVLQTTVYAEPDRSPWVRRTDFDIHPVAITHAATNGFRALALGAALPTACALRRFTYVRDKYHTYDFHQTCPRGSFHHYNFP